MIKAQSAKRIRNIFNPVSKEPFKLSRSRLENFINCKRCFYLDRRCGIDQPPGYPFTLNSAVDHLLKKEFDVHRAKGTAHPLMKTYGVDAVPFQHPDMNTWRENFVGVQYHHKPTNFIVTGAVDDVWVNPKKELYVVDYKATSTDGEISMNSPYREGYKRQMEIYQWLLRQNGFSVSDTGYFVYANGKKDRKAFDGKLEFEVEIIPYKGKADWVEQGLLDAHACLMGDKFPKSAPDCPLCLYRAAAKEVE
ncbi:MAG: PD-(D/E)XK nuclease family protein [bacterium]|nr:PD-(D/E)XK nuclease family protein [bacterium]